MNGFESVQKWTLIQRKSEKQIKPTSHFANDLGLDSLDTVEVVMAIEDVRPSFPFSLLSSVFQPLKRT